jgi:IS30 family transposase
MMEMSLSLSAIARRLGRRRSTVQRELSATGAPANARLRRELPRKTSHRDYSDADIDDVIWNLNATPRKCLGYRTPIEAFAANLGVALET